MPTKQLEDLPSDIREQLTDGAQQIFLAAYNSAQQDGMSEEAALKVAWNSIQENYNKGEDGKWHRKPDSAGIHHKAITTGGN